MDIKQIAIDLGSHGVLHITYAPCRITDDDLIKLVGIESVDVLFEFLANIIVGWDFYATHESCDPLPVSE